MTYMVEQLGVDALRQMCNVELLYDSNTANPRPFGVRLRFYGKHSPKDMMVWGVGEDYDEAALAAVMAVKRREYQRLDWAYRPWADTPEASGDGWMV